MGSSLVLQGGAAVTKTLKEAVAQTAHGFTVGSVVRWDYANSKYITAIADSAANAEVAGVINQVDDADNFQITYHGYIEIPQLAGISAPVMFLSGVSGGSLAASPPSAVGTVVKPVLTKNTNGSGYLVMNYLGTQIGGSSTIAVDEIQPVGTIMPFAGTAIPETWLACDGNSYAMSSYPELYSKLCYATGERAPMYGHIVDIAPSSGTIATTEWTASAVGDYIYIKNRTTTAGGGTPDVNTEASYDFLGRIIAKGTLPSNPAAQGWTVRILGKYNSTSKRFEMPNAFVLSEAGTGFASSVRVYATVATGPRGSGGSINTAIPVAFNTPNLRGRFLFGEVGSGEIIPDADPTTLSTFAYDYPMASWGGEERHVITTAEMPIHTHAAPTPNGIAGVARELPVATSQGIDYADGQGPVPTASAGGDQPHNNMPPYLAVRYIIKAKPYTRAAIIDGIDLPYNSLLVRDLRSRNVGGSNGDLVFHTNTSGDSGNGTERMRIYGNGNTGDILFSGAGDSTTTNPLILSVGGIRINSNRDDAFFISTKQDGTTVGHFGFNGYSTQTLKYTEWEVSTRGVNDTSSQTRLYINNLGNVGIATSTPGATLDVNGTVRIRGGAAGTIGVNDRLVAADANGTLKWDSTPITNNLYTSVNFTVNPSAAAIASDPNIGYTTSLASTTITRADFSGRTVVYTSTSVTLPRGVYICQPYNNLTYSSNFRASARYYGRIGLEAVSGTLQSTSAINIDFNYDLTGAKFSADFYSPSQYDMIPFVFAVTSSTAAVKGYITHMNGGTISVVNTANVGISFQIYRIA